MNFRLALTLLFVSCVVKDNAQQLVLPPCRTMTPERVPKYHSDDNCDRAAQNSLENRMLKDSRHEALLEIGISHIPNQLTIICPEQPIHLTSASGHVTKWIVENKSSGDAVVLFVADGVEYSVLDRSISAPQAGSNAILKPGDWMAIDTFEGHIFHVREILPDGSFGKILLQHRPGLIGFTNRFNRKLDCDDYEDIEPMVEVYSTPEHREGCCQMHDPKPQPKMDPIIKTHPYFERTPEHREEEHCHIVYQGFRNLLPNCPLDVHYTGMQEATDGPMLCDERFKFHLGLKDDTENYMDDWDSRTKFEATYIGHTFSARLATNPDIVVDSFTLQPTEIHDCPSLKQEPIAGQYVIQSNGIQHDIHDTLNESNMENSVNVTTSPIVTVQVRGAGSEYS